MRELCAPPFLICSDTRLFIGARLVNKTIILEYIILFDKNGYSYCVQIDITLHN